MSNTFISCFIINIKVEAVLCVQIIYTRLCLYLIIRHLWLFFSQYFIFGCWGDIIIDEKHSFQPIPLSASSSSLGHSWLCTCAIVLSYKLMHSFSSSRSGELDYCWSSPLRWNVLQYLIIWLAPRKYNRSLQNLMSSNGNSQCFNCTFLHDISFSPWTLFLSPRTGFLITKMTLPSYGNALQDYGVWKN